MAFELFLTFDHYHHASINKLKRHMKKITLKMAALCAIMALLSEVTFAQSSSDPSSSSGQSSQSGSSGSSSGSQSAGQKMKSVELSKLMKADVKTAQGEKLGKIHELVADPQTGEIQFAVIGVGGSAGIGEQLKPIPWKAISVQSDRDCIAKIDKAKLESGPTLQKGRMSDLQNPDYVSRLYTFYGMEPSSATGGTGSQGGAGQGGGSSSKQPNSSSSSQPDSSSSSSGASPK
jgi:sporulation protein YlmC with PRC-barrel domain